VEDKRGGRVFLSDKQIHLEDTRMAKREASKHKIDRRWGKNLWGRAKSPLNRRNYGPGQHGQNRKAKLSDYGTQFRAKQMLKGYYGLSEKQFHGLYKKAIRLKGDPVSNLIGLLERRLDAVAYRARLAPTVFAARQLISHGHLSVDGQRVTIPSYSLKVGEIVHSGAKDVSIGLIKRFESQVLNERDVPPYVSLESSETSRKASLLRIPTPDEVPYAAIMDANLVIEFYSR
jgi:small subunit ribosomal protein S4